MPPRLATVPFEFVPTRLPDVVLIRPRVFGDARGFFMETYKRSAFAEAGFPDFVQDNHSRSTRGVLRGLHYQADPHAQGKLVRATAGSIFDVAVDVRRHSPTLGAWVAARLSAENREMLYVPPGFAHGFLVTSDVADVQYKTTGEYHAPSERSIRYDDPAIGIEWPDIGVDPIVSDNDAAAPGFADAEFFDRGGGA
jgi:dTDP-4-dehydrorhamnose 3,5-epimerase